MKAILLDEAKKWLEENCENQYTRMAVFGIMQSMPTVDYQKTPSEPLTIEQLREMDGEPAYWPEDDSWGIISVDSYGLWAGKPFFRGRKQEVNFEYNIESRGMEVYAYPPAHIDREAWTGCECNNGKKNCCTCVSMQCHFCVNGSEYNQGSYCSACGRPLTPEAWAELEKRLRG